MRHGHCRRCPSCLEVITKRAHPSLTLTHAPAQAIEDGSDLDAREDMCITSLFGGLALANAKLGKLAHHRQPRQAKYQPTVGALITGAVHGFAGPLGGMFPSGPHGALCAATLPHVMRANIKALKVSICVGGCAFSRDGQHSVCLGRVLAWHRNECLGVCMSNGTRVMCCLCCLCYCTASRFVLFVFLPRSYTEIGRILTGKDSATAEDGTLTLVVVSAGAGAMDNPSVGVGVCRM